MTIVKCLFSYLSSPHVLTQPLMGADHVTIVTTLSHFCHEARIVRDTRDTCQCIFSPSGWTRDQQVSQHRNIDFLDLSKSRHCHMIVSHIKYNLSWQGRPFIFLQRVVMVVTAVGPGICTPGSCFFSLVSSYRAAEGCHQCREGGMVPMRANRGSYIYKGQSGHGGVRISRLEDRFRMSGPGPQVSRERCGQ